MIIFKKIKYKNILSVGNNFIEISLNDTHTTLFLGESGAGKTVMLDAISFALFNRPFRNISKSQIVNSINDKNCLVEIEFSLAKDNYLVKRGIKPNIFEIYKNDVLLNQESHNKDYQDILEKQILKFNYKAFSQIVVLGACNFVPFMQLKAADRRTIIENLLDIEIFSLMNTQLKSRISTNKSAIVEVQSKINFAEEKLKLHIEYSQKKSVDKSEIIQRNEKTLEEHKNSIRDRLKEKTTIAEEIKSKNSLLTEKKKLLSKYENKKELREEIFEIKSTLTQRKSSLQKLKDEIKFYQKNDNCPTCKQSITDDFKTGTIKGKSFDITACDEAIETLGLLLEQKNKVLADIESEEKTFLDGLKKDESEIRVLENKVTSIDSANSVTVSVCKKLEKEIENLKVETPEQDFSLQITETKNEIEELKKEKLSLLQDKETHDVCAELLNDSGIKAKIIKQYIALINQYTNKFLTAMNFFVQFNLDEEFNEQIRSVGKDVFSYANFSEGEKQRLDLALLFTWRTIAKMKNSINTNLLITDEILDSFLDLDASEHILQMMKTVISRDNNIIIISHKQQLSDKVDRVLHFSKKSGFTSII